MAAHRGLTVGEAIKSLFPDGYLDYPTYRGIALGGGDQASIALPQSYDQPPCLAVDLFAIAGLLLQRSGAYHHVVMAVSGVSVPRLLAVQTDDREQWVTAGEAWRGDGKKELPGPPAALMKAWRGLLSASDEPVFQASPPALSPPFWWKDALALFCIADEAARDVGFATGRTRSAQALQIELRVRQIIKSGGKCYSISGADRDHLCVLPKSRTPRVGCTLRSLSHHLALLPPRGLARAYWTPAWSTVEQQESGDRAFNMLIVPMPYRIRATAFAGVSSDDQHWGWFSVDPHWCPGTGDHRIDGGIDGFLAFIGQLIVEARRDVGTVHGLVLPEVALSHDVFHRLCDHLKEREGFELAISGLFDARGASGNLRHGNFAAMARFGMSSSGERDYSISIREKHHRWRLDRAQIEAYALGSSLNANHGWWERIDILSRSLDMFVLRGNATVTTLICEDLARNDPCQELVRGIGANLVVALLMDGAQLKDRWPARYATVLADDPGSSVLTLTSFGMIRRSNETGLFPLPPSRQIGLWRDDSGRVNELALPAGAQGLCLSLQPTQLVERTLDGRDDQGDAQSWRLTGVIPVALAEPCSQIMEGLWPGD